MRIGESGMRSDEVETSCRDRNSKSRLLGVLKKGTDFFQCDHWSERVGGCSELLWVL